ncbi:ATP-binding protein [uncultured Sphingomonas sp.]|uniref:ATP-binding protein n=1 Tax=uncultured Sphingomonas sp. TaxID=158754 RepID=UPI0025CE5E4E|nr:ATP-binding protein [uncultured Sphingomonas sp.]
MIPHAIRPALLALLVTCSATPALGQRANATLEQRYDAVRAGLVAEPEEGLRQSVQLERAATSRDGARSRIAAASIWLQAEAYSRLGNIEKARAEINRALKIVQTMRPRIALEGDILRTRGDLASDESAVASALADYQAAYRIYQGSGDARGQAMALLSIGALYRQGADYEAALRYHDQAIEAYAADPLLLVSLLNNRGNVLTEMGRYRPALVDQRRALDLVSGLKNPAFEARILGNIARAQRAAGLEDAAWRSISSGLQLARESQADAVLKQLETLAGRIAIDRGQPGVALQLLDRAFAGIDLKTTPLAARDNHRNAYIVYAAAGETAKALAHLEALDRLNEQATQLTTSTKTALMSARFDFQNQELRIARLKQEELRRNVAFERESARFQRILFGSIAAAVAVLVALLAFGVLTLRRSRDMIRRANVDLAATNAALEKALKAKGDFLATTSHEIRTPLNGILGMAQVMLRDDRLAPDMRDRLDIIHDAGVTMRSLVDDILDVAKMESGKLTVERMPTDLIATIEDLARLWRRQAEDRGLGFVLDLGPVPRWVEGDPVRLRQILFNLLSNALKFTPTGQIALRVAATGDRLVIAVVDTGIGIAPDRLEDVFESFQQADNSTTRRFGGTGLGLTICRNLARAMGGDITVSSAPGAGTTFLLDLPLVPVMPDADAAPVSDDTPPADMLLVLERNPIARAMMRTLFAGHVADTVFVDDADTLRERLAQDGVRAVLVDTASLSAGSSDPVRDMAALAELAARRGVRMAVMARAQELVASEGQAITLLRKPVSATQLIDALFVESEEGAPAVSLVPDAA